MLRTLLLSVLVSVVPPVMADDDTSSALAGHASPYIAMHADDPVAWRLWDPSVLKEARDQGKLIFISSGYFTCRWCHVMQQQSFRNDTIASFLNEHFIPVKIDREVSPVLDRYLVDFVERTRGAAGWPLNVFLTPEGYPLVGTVYLEPDQFFAFLQRLQARWESDPSELSRLASEAAAESEPGSGRAAGPPEPAEVRVMVDAFHGEVIERGDLLAGGFGDEGKFPSVPQLDALLRLHEHYPEVEVTALLRLTLDQMAGKGLRDHLGGGFFRYTVDPSWEEPHFEKMLYVNAQLATMYLRAGRLLDDVRYRQIGLETVDFVLDQMAHPDGGYVAGLSSVDGDGVDGGYYLWNADALRDVLTPDELSAVDVAWNLDGVGSHDAGDLPIPAAGLSGAAATLGVPVTTLAGDLNRARIKLLGRRGDRTLPRDEKRIAAWNGLMLTALAEATLTDGAERYRIAGGELYRFLGERMWNDGSLRRLPSSQRAVPASLADYAYVAEGMTAWAAATGDSGARERGRAVAEAAWERFYDAGAWYPSGEAVLPGMGGHVTLVDTSLPSAGAVLASVSLALAEERPGGTLRRNALNALAGPADWLLSAPFEHASYIAVLASSFSAPPGDGTDAASGEG